jgi:protein O-GlcNAc transferase
VFCCFNNGYKITPDIFDRWMRILAAVEGSVLWLLDDSEAAVANLGREAEGRRIDPSRLVFAKRLSPADHLARHRCADLFLDTLPYNAHTTASDALWAGLPLLTCEGNTFAGRVAASLLRAIDLPELITHNGEDFERRAIDLALHPERLSAIRERLAQHRSTTPLFDTRGSAQDIEAAFRIMWERHKAGLDPQHFTVQAN